MLRFLLHVKKIWGVALLGGVVIAITTAFLFTKSVQTLTVTGSTITILVQKDTLVVQVCSSNILKVHYLPDGKSTLNTEVIGKTSWTSVKAEVNTKVDPMIIKTNCMIIKINKTTFKISVYDSKNKLLLKEQDVKNLYQNGVKFNHLKGQNFYGINAYSANDYAETLLRNEGNIVTAGTQGNAGGPFLWSTSG
jgi:alpha-glucosidase